MPREQAASRAMPDADRHFQPTLSCASEVVHQHGLQFRDTGASLRATIITKARSMKPEGTQRLTVEPLYKKAESALVQRIVEGVWRPGTRLPNEFELAAEFGVSQGTIRKALVSLEQRGLLARKSGRDTTVAKPTAQESLYTFFRLRDGDGDMAVFEPLSERLGRRAATSTEKKLFGEAESHVCTLERVRQHGGKLFALERMRFSATLVEGIEEGAPLPNSLYPYLQERFGLSIMTAEEAITAVIAGPKDASALTIDTGAPLLRVERRARDLADRIVELRVSLYLTTHARYCVELARAHPFARSTQR